MPGRATPITSNTEFRDGYWLVPRDTLLWVSCPAGGHFVIDYDVCLKLAPSTAQKTGREFAAPLELKPQENKETHRWDLRVDPARGADRGAKHTFFHRLLGLSLRKTEHDTLGRKLQRRRLVPPGLWDDYEVHHKNWNNLDCRLQNLQPQAKVRHRGQGRDGWSKKAMTHKLKVAHLAVLRRPAATRRRPASATR